LVSKYLCLVTGTTLISQRSLFPGCHLTEPIPIACCQLNMFRHVICDVSTTTWQQTALGIAGRKISTGTLHTIPNNTAGNPAVHRTQGMSYTRPLVITFSYAPRRHDLSYHVQYVGKQGTTTLRTSGQNNINSEKISRFIGGPGSSVGIATDYGLDGPGIESRWGPLVQ
jgi:hypothetical protein